MCYLYNNLAVILEIPHAMAYFGTLYTITYVLFLLFKNGC